MDAYLRLHRKKLLPERCELERRALRLGVAELVLLAVSVLQCTQLGAQRVGNTTPSADYRPTSEGVSEGVSAPSVFHTFGVTRCDALASGRRPFDRPTAESVSLYR